MYIIMLMKQILKGIEFLLICIVCVSLFSIPLLLVGCKTNEENENGLPVILCTTYPASEFTKNICGKSFYVKNLIPIGQESHTYEPTSKDILSLNNCVLLIYTGGESETFVDKMLSSIDKEIQILKMIDYVDPIIDEDHGEIDEHVWTSPVCAKEISKGICDTLCSLFSDQRETFLSNYNNYALKLDDLHSQFSSFFNSTSQKILVVADKFPFAYFAREYNIAYYSAYHNCGAETEVSAKKVAELIDITKYNKVHTIYYLEFSNHKIADIIAEETGAKTASLHAYHNLSQEDYKNNVTFIELMERNLQTLMEGENDTN